MIDPSNVTNYNRTEEELEEFLLFCISVIQTNAYTAARSLDKLLSLARRAGMSPFQSLPLLGDYKQFEEALRSCGFGKYRMKARAFIEACDSHLDLRTCTPEQLEELHGVGMKTSRFFILHSRQNARVAVIDTHMFRWMCSRGWCSPSRDLNRKLYLELESRFLEDADSRGRPPADLDLEVWLQGRKERSNERKS